MSNQTRVQFGIPVSVAPMAALSLKGGGVPVSVKTPEGWKQIGRVHTLNTEGFIVADVDSAELERLIPRQIEGTISIGSKVAPGYRPE